MPLVSSNAVFQQRFCVIAVLWTAVCSFFSVDSKYCAVASINELKKIMTPEQLAAVVDVDPTTGIVTLTLPAERSPSVL